MARDTGAAGKRKHSAPAGKALWLLGGAAVVVGLGVIVVQGDSPAGKVLATGLAIGGALLGMAWKADDMVSKELREDLSLWLLCIEPEKVGKSIQRWPAHFAALFDRVFTKKHLSWRCFFRSSPAVRRT